MVAARGVQEVMPKGMMMSQRLRWMLVSVDGELQRGASYLLQGAAVTTARMKQAQDPVPA